MAAVDRVNGTVVALSTLYRTSDVNVFKINPGAALTASTQAGGAGTAITKGNVERIADELSPLMFETDSDGDMVVVMHGHPQDVDAIARKVDLILGGAGVLTNTGQTALVTVTAPDSIIGQ